MPPRKRKTSDAASAPQPTKRVTRSSTKADTTTAQPAAQSNKAETPEVESKSSKKTGKAAPNTKSKSKAAANESGSTTTSNVTKTKSSSKTSGQLTGSKPPSNYEALSITSDLIKNPIQCYSYPSGSNPNTSTPPLIFTHGAGGTLSAPAVVNFCTGFSTTHHSILAFQGSMNLGSRVKGFHACIQHLGRESKKLVLGGRSMGARAAVMAASEVLEEDEDKEVELVLVSYPLQGPKAVRNQILLDLPESVRVLFVIGERDGMCPLDLLEGVRKKMKAKSQSVIVRGADHGMHTKPAKMEKGVGEETGRVAARWLAGDMQDEVTYVGEEG
jgi:predicted alpha/beta-hydrolase family hydrolase